MSKGLGKFYIGKYAGAASAAWKEAVGVTLKGNDKVATTDPTRTGPRKVCLPILEGLAAVCARQVLASHVTPDGAIYLKVDAAAYEDSVVVTTPPAGDVVGYYDRPRALLGSSLPSSSGSGSKTEFSLAASALVEACELFSRDENLEAKALLAAHLEILTALEAVGALPLGTLAVDRSALPEDFERKLGDLTDRVYQWVMFSGKRKGVVPATEWGYSPIVAWPVAGDASEEISSIASGGLHNTIADPRRLESLLRVAPTASAVAPAGPEPKPTAPKVGETLVERAVRWARRVNIPLLLSGPAGTGKTLAATYAADHMPVFRTSMTAEADIATAVGDLARSASGEWVPRLGRLAAVVRYAMLAALIVALRRGRALTHPDPDAFHTSDGAREVWWALEALAADPDDASARAGLDERAWPYDPESWAPVLHAWTTTESFTIGPVVSLFLDEIHDAANANSSFQTLLKLALEGDRVFLTEIAGAGWAPMFCHNVAFLGAGNPDEHGAFGRALRSRFGFTIGVGYPSRDQAIRWHESRFGSGAKGAGVAAPSASLPLALVDARYEPPVAAASSPLTAKEIAAVVDFGIWTREENRAGRLAEGLETRGEAQVCQLMRYLRSDEGLATSEAFAAAASLVVDRLCVLDDLGLPDHEQREATIQKIEQIARRL